MATLQGSTVYISRTVRCFALTIYFGLCFLACLLSTERVRAILLRRYLEACQGAFVKLGQILAMRYDLLSPTYCEELAHLLDRVRPSPTPAMLRTIEAELERPIASCFAEFDSKPVGSASLAQAYTARLHSGENVVVKVLRTGIESQVRVDLGYLSLLGHILDATGLLFPFSFASLIKELRRLTFEELDLRREARNAQMLHDLMLSDSVDHYAPRVFFEFSRQRVLTLEKLEGVWLHELLSAVVEKDETRLAHWRSCGISSERTARLLFRSIMVQCYQHRVFHCDPHAGNLIVLNGGTLGYIDFGMVGWLDEREWALQYRLFENIANGRLQASYDALVESLDFLTARDLSDFELDFKTILRDWVLAVQSRHATLKEKSTGLFLLSTAQLIGRAGLKLPLAVTRLHRTTIISDMIELRLFPELNVVREMEDFFNSEDAQTLCRVFSSKQLQTTVGDWLQLALFGPQHGLRVLRWLDTQLPMIRRAVDQQANGLEAVVYQLLRYLWWLALLLFVIFFFMEFIFPQYPSAFPMLRPWREDLMHLNEASRVVLIVGSLGAVFVLGRLVKRFETPEITGLWGR